MVRRVQFGLHEMRSVPVDERIIAKNNSHWSNRLPKMVIVTRSGVKTDNAIVNVQQPKAVVFHEYQSGEPWNETIMEEDRFRRVYRFVTKNVMTYMNRREEAYILGIPVKKKRNGRK